MRFVLRFVLAGMCCAGLAVGVIAWRTGLEGRGKIPPAVRGASEASTGYNRRGFLLLTSEWALLDLNQ